MHLKDATKTKPKNSLFWENIFKKPIKKNQKTLKIPLGWFFFFFNQGFFQPCLQQVDPDKDFAATLALVFPRRRMLRIVIGAESPLRVFAVSATVLQGVDFDVTFEIAAQ